MSKRKNTFTRFIEDIVDDTKDFVDDVLDRAKDLETDVKDAIQDVVDDDETTPVSTTSGAGVADLQAALADLTAKVNQLAELQLASASSTSSSTTSSSRRTAAA
jgi:polyhydroxyalkanoate synthesis regulator phasin